MPKEIKLTKQQQQQAESLGGQDVRLPETREPTYCDKGGHKERSIANSPQRREHRKKEGK
jgi:hypothetical protein